MMFFLFFKITDLYFLITAIAKIFNPAAELVTPIGYLTSKAKRDAEKLCNSRN